MPFTSHPQPSHTDAADERAVRRDCAGLQLALRHQLPLTRRWAARDLADCPDAAACLVAQLGSEADRSVREVIFSSLTALGNTVAVAGLVHCLRSEQAALRNEAIDSMKKMPLQVAPIMHGLLHDADPDVRIFAVNILESLHHPEVERWLIAIIGNDPEVNVCGSAVDLLCELGTEAARPALQQLKTRFSEQPYIQFAADLALRRLTTS